MSHHYDGIDGTNANESPDVIGSDLSPMPTTQDLERIIPEEDWDSIQYWQKYIMAWAETKGWNQGLEERSFGDWCTLLHTEISEAYEDRRNGYGYNEVYYEVYTGDTLVTIVRDSKTLVTYTSRGYKIKPCGIPIEMADLAIRLFHLAEFFGFDLTQMIADKMEYNQKRPFRHGGKKV